MTIATNLGFPRMGPNRELKRAIEGFWAGSVDEAAMLETAATIRKDNWLLQSRLGIDHIPSNDFSLYDQVLDTTAMVGAVPPRYGHEGGMVGLDTYFAMARGTTADGERAGVPPMEMKKWFDTNYHYLVPEFERNQTFTLSSTKAIDEFLEAKALGIHTRPVLLGPTTYLMLGKMADEPDGDPLALLENLLPAYEDVLKRLTEAGADWVQIDEPVLGIDLDDKQRATLGRGIARLSAAGSKLRLMVAVYFSDLRENMKVALALPVSGLHLDLVRGGDELDSVIAKLPESMSLSLGLVDGRNVWRTDLAAAIKVVTHAVKAVGSDRVMVGPSCSLLHSPVDLGNEPDLDTEMKSWLAFAKQKIEEIATITAAVDTTHTPPERALAANAKAMAGRRSSARIHRSGVAEALAAITPEMLHRASPFPERRKAQAKVIKLPAFPTTTIGSFPQTAEIRKMRAARARGSVSEKKYQEFLKNEIASVIKFQEKLGLDVLVHGEPERNDMVEYFAERLEGYVSTANGWVQSYGTRMVKPPIIFGDIHRPKPITVTWTTYAQSLTKRPVKGMLTGPVTMLQWSFVRDDQPRGETCRQLALAIRGEVADLEKAGTRIIQIDEPAIREGLPLRGEDRADYLAWAVECFRLASSSVADTTQIHTHMCYAAYDEIIDAISDLDADVLSMESSRSGMDKLRAFDEHPYPNDIGPGVYDIHSPRVASMEEMRERLDMALTVLTREQLWVNPDCGLKTRRWDEVEESLKHMVAAAKSLR
ncbi:MAG: 5-methyltetrahydropteroyltriglutamate--homocysteine S-methyltransferase [Chloroflexi bacterium]|nr:5-methyltetrahydropteroyltriglutamate--homocysteine S-methyltransferase [Chloroflexota bacterium]